MQYGVWVVGGGGRAMGPQELASRAGFAPLGSPAPCHVEGLLTERRSGGPGTRLGLCTKRMWGYIPVRDPVGWPYGWGRPPHTPHATRRGSRTRGHGHEAWGAAVACASPSRHQQDPDVQWGMHSLWAWSVGDGRTSSQAPAPAHTQRLSGSGGVVVTKLIRTYPFRKTRRNHIHRTSTHLKGIRSDWVRTHTGPANMPKGADLMY